MKVFSSPTLPGMKGNIFHEINAAALAASMMYTLDQPAIAFILCVCQFRNTFCSRFTEMISKWITWENIKMPLFWWSTNHLSHFSRKMPIILWFQLPKLWSLSCFSVKLNIFSFWTAGLMKQCVWIHQFAL